MKKLMVTYKPFDIVLVPFPFTDNACLKKRPALILSSTLFSTQTGHSLMAMITSAKNSAWPFDIAVPTGHETGLQAASIIRMKLFTLDNRYILQLIGHLTDIEVQSLIKRNLKNIWQLK